LKKRAHRKPHDGGRLAKPPRNSVLEHICAQETLESCVKCEGVAAQGEVCELCQGAGMVKVSRNDKWRIEHGMKPQRGPLPPIGDPPTIPPK
jgi:hypothetical protein